MSRIKLTTLREMNDHDLEDKLLELKADLAKLRSEGAKGTLKKESSSIRWARRDIARILTLINERKMKKESRNENNRKYSLSRIDRFKNKIIVNVHNLV